MANSVDPDQTRYFKAWETNSVDPDQTAPIGAVCSGSTLFVSQALKYLEIGTCPASQKLLAYMEKMLIYIGNHPKFHLPCSLRHS